MKDVETEGLEAKVTVRLPLRMKERLDNLAKSEGKSLSDIVRESVKIPEEKTSLYSGHVSKELQGNIKSLSFLDRLKEFGLKLEIFRGAIEDIEARYRGYSLPTIFQKITDKCKEIERELEEVRKDLREVKALRYF